MRHQVAKVLFKVLLATFDAMRMSALIFGMEHAKTGRSLLCSFRDAKRNTDVRLLAVVHG